MSDTLYLEGGIGRKIFGKKTPVINRPKKVNTEISCFILVVNVTNHRINFRYKLSKSYIAVVLSRWPIF